MAPEQLAGAPVDHRADVFSTGAVPYELLARKPAFAGTLREGVMLRILHLGPEPIERVCPDLDPELYAVARRALARDPGERYQSLSSLGADLLRIRMRLSGELPRAPVAGDADDDPRDAQTVKLQAARRDPVEERRATGEPRTHTRRSRGATAACAGVAFVSLAFVGPLSWSDGTPATPHRLASRHPLPTAIAMLPGAMRSPALRRSPPSRAAQTREPALVAEGRPALRSEPRLLIAPAPLATVARDDVAPATVTEAPRVQSPDVELTTPSRPAPREPDELEAIRQVLREYVEAMSARDGERLSAVLRMDAATRSRQEAFLREYDEVSMRLLRVDAPRVVADRAIVRCVIQETVAHGGRRSAPGPSDIEVSLVRSAGRWTISGIRGR